MGSANPFVAIGFVLSVLAALVAFLITYEEWSHHYAGKREPLMHGLEAAAIAFLVFMALTVLANVFVALLTE